MNKLVKILCCGLIMTGCLGSIAFAADTGKASDNEVKADDNNVTYYYNDKEVSLAKAAKIAQKYDVVFFDEFHDQGSIHQAEAAFFKQMYKDNQDMILSLEMFERDVQPVMDEYLSGKITEDEFKASSRPWPNYQTDYRPLIEFAKVHDIYVLAGNIPRRMANQYAKAGDFSTISDADKQYLPQKHLVEYKDYYNKFKTYMSSGDENTHMMMTPERIEKFYKAQCLKDDTMAESIVNYNKANPDTKILHMQGEFHGGDHLGVVEKVHKLNPDLKLLVITPVETKDYNSVKDKFGKNDIVLTFVRK